MRMQGATGMLGADQNGTLAADRERFRAQWHETLVRAAAASKNAGMDKWQTAYLATEAALAAVTEAARNDDWNTAGRGARDAARRSHMAVCNAWIAAKQGEVL